MPRTNVSISPAEPSFGQQITISSDTTDPRAIADVRAYQNGQMVYRELSLYYKGDNIATLGPTPSWSGGPADGEVRMGSGGNRLTFPKRPDLEFHING